MQITNKYKRKIQKAGKSPSPSPLILKADPGQAYVRNVGNDNGWFNLYRIVVNSVAADFEESTRSQAL